MLRIARGWWQESPVTRESAEETVKTIAQGMPGLSGEPVVTTLVCFLFLHARLRVHWAPGIPCAPYFSRGGRFQESSGTSRAAGRWARVPDAVQRVSGAPQSRDLKQNREKCEAVFRKDHAQSIRIE